MQTRTAGDLVPRRNGVRYSPASNLAVSCRAAVAQAAQQPAVEVGSVPPEGSKPPVAKEAPVLDIATPTTAVAALPDKGMER